MNTLGSVDGESEMDRGTSAAMAPCPDCGRIIALGLEPKHGQKALCPGGGIYLEIVSLEPLEFDWVTHACEQDLWPERALGC
jgi:hypothetical protein